MGASVIRDDLPHRTPRQQVLLGAEICGFGGGTPTRHRIKDLSMTGARIDRAGMLKSGSTVLVSVGTLQAVGATVVWVKDDVAGLRFVEAIDPDAARSKTILPSASQPDLAMKPVVIEQPRASAGWIRDMRNRHL
ncbi:PilZ domain-containing protein [Sphingomonas sp. LT1P40]|uniref:PilZ domain-containing protein n=1 Tax=Alteristakelama amylovorans TaxID=3096166 RepID=UPI002FC8583C